MPNQTVRFAMPLLAAGQAQKELTHNEALTIADLLLACVVESNAPPSVPASPTAGQGWIVGSAPTGAWAGQAGRLAFWTEGGWRFASAPVGMAVWSIADNVPIRRTASGWIAGQVSANAISVAGQQVVGARLAAVAAPTGGTTIDAECRAALDTLIDRLRTHGLIA